jgi:5-methylcytosine-specific restriction endonuclease McrA
MVQSPKESQYIHRRTKKGTISNKRCQAKKSAKDRGREFSLTTPELHELWDAQEGCCALCGGKLGVTGDGWCAASIDRIDPARGYTMDNVQWTHWRCNDAKTNMTNEDFINMCAAITAHNFIRK